MAKTKLQKYFGMELYYTKVHLEGEKDPIARNKICWLCLQRCLGAAQLAELMGVPYETVENLYNKQRELLQEMENGLDKIPKYVI